MDEATPTKTCTRCGESKEREAFYKNSARRDGMTNHCKPCVLELNRARRARYAARANVATPADKMCAPCGFAKPASEFYTLASSPDGLGPYCAACVREKRRAFGKANRKKETAKTAKHRANNPEAYRTYMVKWRQENPDLVKANGRRWAQDNADRLAQAKRLWFELNRDKVMARRAERVDEIREINRRSALKTRDARTERQRQRRAVTKGAEVISVDLDALWTGMCGLCDEVIDPDLHWPDPKSKSIDHIMPLSLGGDHVADNLQWAHLFCNVSKGNRI